MIRRHRVDIHQTKTGHERWLVSYADFITLLFGFFVVMYSVSQVSEQKYRALSETLASTFDGRRSRDKVQEQPLNNPIEVADLSSKNRLADVKDLANNLAEALAPLIRSNDISILATEEWLEIDLNANLLFQSASAELSEQARRIFLDVANDLAPYENEIAVSGHTDNVPISTDDYASNWELSSARAVSVVQLLTHHGIEPSRLSAIGFGEFRPVSSNETDEGKAENRRVVLRVAAHQPQKSALGERGRQFQPSAATTTSERRSGDALDDNNVAEEPIKPVKLDNGGLLFTSDPDLPRKTSP